MSRHRKGKHKHKVSPPVLEEKLSVLTDASMIVLPEIKSTVFEKRKKYHLLTIPPLPDSMDVDPILSIQKYWVGEKEEETNWSDAVLKMACIATVVMFDTFLEKDESKEQERELLELKQFIQKCYLVVTDEILNCLNKLVAMDNEHFLLLIENLAKSIYESDRKNQWREYVKKLPDQLRLVFLLNYAYLSLQGFNTESIYSILIAIVMQANLGKDADDADKLIKNFFDIYKVSPEYKKSYSILHSDKIDAMKIANILLCYYTVRKKINSKIVLKFCEIHVQFLIEFSFMALSDVYVKFLKMNADIFHLDNILKREIEILEGVCNIENHLEHVAYRIFKKNNYRLGLIELASSEPDFLKKTDVEIEDLFEKAAENEPFLYTGLISLAKFYIKNNKWKNAKATLLKAGVNFPVPEIMNELIVFYAKLLLANNCQEVCYNYLNPIESYLNVNQRVVYIETLIKLNLIDAAWSNFLDFEDKFDAYDHQKKILTNLILENHHLFFSHILNHIYTENFNIESNFIENLFFQLLKNLLNSLSAFYVVLSQEKNGYLFKKIHNKNIVTFEEDLLKAIQLFECVTIFQEKKLLLEVDTSDFLIDKAATRTTLLKHIDYFSKYKKIKEDSFLYSKKIIYQLDSIYNLLIEKKHDDFIESMSVFLTSCKNFSDCYEAIIKEKIILIIKELSTNLDNELLTNFVLLFDKIRSAKIISLLELYLKDFFGENNITLNFQEDKIESDSILSPDKFLENKSTDISNSRVSSILFESKSYLVEEERSEKRSLLTDNIAKMIDSDITITSKAKKNKKDKTDKTDKTDKKIKIHTSIFSEKKNKKKLNIIIDKKSEKLHEEKDERSMKNEVVASKNQDQFIKTTYCYFDEYKKIGTRVSRKNGIENKLPSALSLVKARHLLTFGLFRQSARERNPRIFYEGITAADLPKYKTKPK